MLRQAISIGWVAIGAAYICGGMPDPSLGDIAGLVCFVMSSAVLTERV